MTTLTNSFSSCKAVYRIETAGYVGAVIVDSTGHVIDSAPVLKWCRGKEFSYVKNYYQSKNASITKL